MARSRSVSELSRSIDASRGSILAVFVFSVVANLLILTGPLFMLQVYDRVLASRSEETLVALFTLVAALWLFFGVLDYARGRIMARIGARLQTAMGARVLRAMAEQSPRQHRGATERSSTDDLETLRVSLSSPAATALFDLPWTPIFALVIFAFHPLLGVLAVLGGAVLLLAAAMNQWSTGNARMEADENRKIAQEISSRMNTVGGFIRVQGMIPSLTERWRAAQTEATFKSLVADDRSGGLSSFSKAFRYFLQSTILALGAWLVLRGDLTAGAMIAASILTGRALAPAEQVIAHWAGIARARQAFNALKRLLDDVPKAALPMELPDPKAHLDIRGLGFFSEAGRPLLHSIDLRLPPGSATGVVGRSGAGKTTLARLIAGEIAPDAGEIRLDGAALAQYGPDRLGRHIGYLPQETILFDGTVAENIARMAIAPDPSSVLAAAQAVGAHDFILELHDGYETRLGKGGIPLSGGQRQRIALARALYCAPALLVLDEPNSALDDAGSEALNAMVRKMKTDGKAIVIMTHRPKAIEECDRIIVLDRGRVTAQGPRDQLLSRIATVAKPIVEPFDGRARA